MMRTALKWTAAIAFSLLAHGVAATLFESQPSDQAEIAGGEAMEVTLLGNAFEDTLQAGDPTEALDPMEAEPEQVEQIFSETAEVVPEEITPIQSEIAAETPSDIPPVEADIILPADEMPPVAEAEVTATVPPVETVVPEEKPEPKKVEKRKEIKKPEPKKQKPVKKKAIRPKSGEDGAAVAAQKKGQADGAEAAKASTAQGKKGAFSRQSGNAAVSNYKGKVRAKLVRASRNPPRAARQGVTGVPWVRFTVLASGAVSGLAIAKSSGSPLLDEAILNAVNRAAPFPPIPEGSANNSLEFLLPMKFNRGR